jgi:hypothetical protein
MEEETPFNIQDWEATDSKKSDERRRICNQTQT